MTVIVYIKIVYTIGCKNSFKELLIKSTGEHLFDLMYKIICDICILFVFFQFFKHKKKAFI